MIIAIVANFEVVIVLGIVNLYVAATLTVAGPIAVVPSFQLKKNSLAVALYFMQTAARACAPLAENLTLHGAATSKRAMESLTLDREAAHELAQSKKSPARKLFRKVLPVNQQLNYFARGNIFEILMRSISGAQIRVAEASCRLADVVLRPDICDDSWLDYRHPGKFIKLGREEAERHLEAIKALVAHKVNHHEPERTPEAMVAIA